jgi:hypothetical protein
VWKKEQKIEGKVEIFLVIVLLNTDENFPAFLKHDEDDLQERNEISRRRSPFPLYKFIPLG